MTSDERRVIECARRVVAAGRVWCDARDAADASRGRGLRMRLALRLADHRAAAENAEAELAMIDAVDALDVARVCVDAPDTGPVTR